MEPLGVVIVKSLAGFRARIRGIDAPIIAARGLIAVQVPFELVMPQFSPAVLIEVLDNGAPPCSR